MGDNQTHKAASFRLVVSLCVKLHLRLVI